MDRQERLKLLWEDLQLYGNDEAFFDTLYKKLIEEVDIETAFNNKPQNTYLKTLKLTKKRHADLYISMRGENPKGISPQQFYEFVSNFRTDLNHAYRR